MNHPASRNRWAKAGISTVILGAVLVLAQGCYQPISIQPSCPAELKVGQIGRLLSGAKNAGEVATFLWEVEPDDLARISNPGIADPLVLAQKPGTAVFTLTASDGLFQVISQCETEIKGE